MAPPGFATIDLWRYLLGSNAAYDHISKWAELELLVREGVRAGQFGPLVALPMALWYVTLNPSFAHYLQIIGIAANMCTFFFLAAQLTRSKSASLFAVVIALGATQFHTAGDPYLSNLFVYPFAAQLVLTALLFFVAPPGGSQIIWRRLASGAFLGLAIAALPACAAFAAVFIAYAWFARARDQALSDSALVVAFTAAGLAIVRLQHVAYASWHDAPRNFVAVIPAAYRASGNIIHDVLSGTDRNTSFDRLPSIDTIGWIVVVLCAAFVYWYLSSSRARENSAKCAVLGIALWICAAFWQTGGSYFECFGFALAAVGALQLLNRLRPEAIRIVPALVAVTMLLVLYGNVRANKLIVHNLQKPWEAFLTVQRGAQRHLFKGINDGTAVALSTKSELLIFAPSPGAQQRLFFALSGKRFVASKRDGGWLLREDIQPFQTRKIELFHLRRTASGLQTDRTEEYREYLTQDERSAFTLSLILRSRGIKTHIREVDDTHILVDVTRTCGPVALSRVFRPEGPGHTWSTGFYPNQFPNPVAIPQIRAKVLDTQYIRDPLWRYARRSADLVLTSDNCGKNITVNLGLLLYSAFPGSIKIRGAKLLKYSEPPAAGPTLAAASQNTFPISQSGAAALLALSIPAHGKSTVHITALTPAASVDTMVPRSEKIPVTDIHLFVQIQGIEYADTKAAQP